MGAAVVLLLPGLPGLSRSDEVARLASDRAGAELGSTLAAHGLRLDAVSPVADDRVCARLVHGDYVVTVQFVLGGEVEHDADAVLDALARPPDTWDARWRGTTDATRDVRPGIAGSRWRMEQA